ncbi:MAG: hypothetical protein HXX08_00810 [Chloroflexi bacterium]|uniref:Uncharacterized protein n=1 Tax=Candidatus Chlorohelix allophototropha TaxID=3003348 RepID=A0A8T7M180_9CHLR|nr:hypothetical protein [Chloroflexota bacterium]WJW66288.1 hypothetical protein OZ401_002081 [Chloroflexota bacterium L227-S17]
MPNTLANILQKNEDKIVDKAATSIKVMYSFAFADVPIEDLRERLYHLLGNLVQISQKGQSQPELIAEFASNVLVGSLYEGFDNRSITEEVLQVVDIVINQTIDASMNDPEFAEDKAQNKKLLAQVIREAKDIVNGRNRDQNARKASKRGEEPTQ